MLTDKPMPIFTAANGFVPESGMGYNAKGLNRINARYHAFIEPVASRIKGKRILDLASHDGRWTYACLVSGAAHVTGVEVRQELIDKSRYIITPEMKSRTRFIQGDLFDVVPRLLQEREHFDIVICLGIFYHVMDHHRLMMLMVAFKPELIIVDTGLVDTDEPMILLKTESSDNFLNGAAIRGSRQITVGIVSRGGVEMMARTAGYSIRHHVWERGDGGVGRKGIMDHIFGRRRRNSLRPSDDITGLVDYYSTNRLGVRRYSFFMEPLA